MEIGQRKGIKVKAVWLYINLKKDQPNALRAQNEVVFENLKSVGLKTQIWVGLDPKYFENLADSESLLQAVDMISYLSKRAKSLSCKLALYNHGGWFGNPEN